MLLGDFLACIEACDSVVCIDNVVIYHWTPDDINTILCDSLEILKKHVSTFHATDAYLITVVLK